MSIMYGGVPKVASLSARPRMVGPSNPRKIGLIGGAAPSLASAPWVDPSWEFWAHASVSAALPQGRCDRYFDLHPPLCFMEEKKHLRDNYYQFLQRCATPLYMQKKYPEIPASVPYPLQTIRELWPDTKFGSMTSYMIALALLEGVTHLGLWGIDYQQESEYAEQRANTEHWVGIAKGAGVHIIIPAVSPLCHEPVLLYAYETHATPELYAARKAKAASFRAAHALGDGSFDPARLRQITTHADLETAEQLRQAKDPGWAERVALITDVEPAWLTKNVGIGKDVPHAPVDTRKPRRRTPVPVRRARQRR